jgi:hypothetical protein
VANPSDGVVTITPHKADVYIHQGVIFESQRCYSYRPDAEMRSNDGHVMGYAYWGMGIPRQHKAITGCVVVIKKLSVMLALMEVLRRDELIDNIDSDRGGFFK